MEFRIWIASAAHMGGLWVSFIYIGGYWGAGGYHGGYSMVITIRRAGFYAGHRYGEEFES